MFSGQLITNENDTRMIKEGAGRLNFTHHIGLWDQAKLMALMLRKEKLFTTS